MRAMTSIPTPPPESSLIDGPKGLVPESDGWFIVNVGDVQAVKTDRFGAGTRFEGANQFPEFGINVRFLAPGQPNCLYHRESVQETFLVLNGECVAIIEEQERQLKTGDFLFVPAGVAHVFVGGSDGPCTILMAGTRGEDVQVHYPVSEVAARYGASVKEATDDPSVAYADVPGFEPTRLPWPLW